jgi:hypothetical protein
MGSHGCGPSIWGTNSPIDGQIDWADVQSGIPQGSVLGPSLPFHPICKRYPQSVGLRHTNVCQRHQPVRITPLLPTKTANNQTPKANITLFQYNVQWSMGIIIVSTKGLYFCEMKQWMLAFPLRIRPIITLRTLNIHLYKILLRSQLGLYQFYLKSWTFSDNDCDEEDEFHVSKKSRVHEEIEVSCEKQE